MFLAALNARYRDIRYTIPFLVQSWMFASPIVYPTSIVPEKYRIIAVNKAGEGEPFNTAIRYGCALRANTEGAEF